MNEPIKDKSTLSIIRPTLPTLREVEDLLRPSWESGQVTVGRVVRDLEEEVCQSDGSEARGGTVFLYGRFDAYSSGPGYSPTQGSDRAGFYLCRNCAGPCLERIGPGVL